MKDIREKRAYIDEFQELAIFKFMSAAEILGLIEGSDLLHYTDGEKIVSQGEINQSILAVVKGTVQVNVVEENGKEVYICSLDSGEIFGEAGMFLRVKRTANIVSLDESVILRVPRSVLMEFIKKNPATGNKLLLVIIHSLLKKLRGANQDLAFERMCENQYSEIDAILEEISER